MESPSTKWQERPVLAGALRALVMVAPILIALVVVLLIGKTYPRPSGVAPTVLYLVVLSAIATVVSLSADRVFRGLLPVVALFQLSLVFPDKAPSRFKTALRAGTVRQLQRSMESGEFSTVAPQEAAEQLVGLASALNEHDRLTRGHTERVRAYSVMIGEEMGLDEHELELLNWSGLVHDIGKLTVPTEILNSPGKPTDEEWAILRDHPKEAERLIEPLRPWLGEWADSATQHHERWDGKGYPYGLAGEQISRAGRIVAVADAYDVMTSTRSYKKPMAAAEARRELAVNAGSQFDPEVVRAFLGIAIGKLRFAAGPLGSLINLPTGGASLGGAAATGATAASSVAVAAVGGIVSGPAPADPVEPLAFAELAPDVEVLGIEDEPLSLDLTVEIVGDGSEIRIIPTNAAGTATVEEGVLTFVPDDDFAGTTSVGYEVCDPSGRCEEGTVTFVVEGVNDAPSSVDDEMVSVEDASAVLRVLDNDIDVDGDALRITAVELVPSPDGLVPLSIDFTDELILLEFEPDASGVVQLAYTVGDAAGVTSQAFVTVVVEAVNDLPDVVDDNATVPEGQSSVIDVLANDTDVDGDTLVIDDVSSVIGGTATTDGETVSFTPSPQLLGAASLIYTVDDGAGGFGSGRVSIVVEDDPARPALVATELTAFEDNAMLIELSALDPLAAALDPASTTVAVPPLFGTALTTTAGVRYIPATDWSGFDTLAVNYCDVDSYCATETLTVAVVPVNDAPVFSTPAAVAVVEDAGPVTVAGWIDDVVTGPADESGQNVSFEVTAADPGLFGVAPTIASNGTLELTTAPDANGATTLTIVAVDDGGSANGGAERSVPVDVAVTVNPVNDAPSFSSGAAQLVLEDAGPQTVVGWATAIDPGPNEAAQGYVFDVQVGDPSLFSTQPSVNAAGDLSYEVAPDVSGLTTVTVTMVDDGGSGPLDDNTSAPSAVSFGAVSVNDAPSFATAGDVTVVEDAGAQLRTGWASTINPGPNEASQAVTFSVVANDPGLFTTLPTVDTFGDLRFEFAPNTSGSTTISVTAIDNGGTADGGVDTSAPQTAVLTSSATNDPPLANDDSGVGFSTTEDTPFTTGDVTANDTDLDHLVDPTSIVVVSGPSNGSVVDNGDGTFDYTPDLDFGGSDTFTYTINDGIATSNVATVTIVITPQNDPPTAAGDGGLGFITTEDTPFTTGDVTANDTDPDHAVVASSTTVVTNPANGSVVANGNGTFDYTPDLNFFGTDQFTYTITDPLSAVSNVATVTISVAADNDAPVAVDDNGVGFATTEDTPFTTDAVTGNDLDVDDAVDPASIVVVSGTSNGSLVDNGDGTFDYTPDLDFFGTDSFTYTITDGAATSNVATVTIAVASGNDPPVAGDDSGAGFAGLEDAILTTADVTANDDDIDHPIDPTSIVVVSGPSDGSVVDNGDGTFDYTPDPDFFGTDQFTYFVVDGGGAGSNIATVTITVGAVNDEPSFTPGPDVEVDPADGLVTLTGWATNIGPGASNESGQSLSFAVSPDQAALFATPLTISSDGLLTIDPAPAASGEAVVTVTLSDDGGTADGGVDTSSAIQFSILMTPADHDGVSGFVDNCLGLYNIDQLDSDGDGIGDACDPSPTAATGGVVGLTTSLDGSNTHDHAIADFDGDGDLDIMFGNDLAGNRLYRNTGIGFFFDSGQSLGSAATRALAHGDLDGDGDLDVLEVNEDEASRVWLNDGSGTFTLAPGGLGSGEGRDGALADFDGDGDLDVVIVRDAESNRIWLNDGDAGFTNSGQTLGTRKSVSVAVGDVDGDGDIDLHVGNFDDLNAMWTNDGSGTFTLTSLAPATDKTEDVALADVDGDGDLDLIIASDNDGPSSVWLNDGAGSYTSTGEVLGLGHETAVAAGDIDGDGDLDLLFAQHNDSETVWLNDGTGSFTDSGQRISAGDVKAVGLADFNNDGDYGVVYSLVGGQNRIGGNT